MLAADLVSDASGDLDLDFRAIMHWGEDVVLEKHYVPRRSQRTRSVLSFFAQDGASQTLVYANADLTKDTQAREVLVFAELDAKGINFLTLRMRSPSLLRHIASLPPSAWRTVALDRDGNYRRPKVVDEQVSISAYPGTVRQLVVTGLGRDAATVIITNDRVATAKQLIERYARRMNIEQHLAESIRSFHLDALAGSVPLNVDLDVALSVLAGAVRASLRRRLTGYHHATPDTLQRRFLSTGGLIVNNGDSVLVQLKRRTYSPVLRQADIPEVAVPWWGGTHPPLRIRPAIEPVARTPEAICKGPGSAREVHHPNRASCDDGVVA